MKKLAYLAIEGSTTIGEIQKKFNDEFPFLNLEFFDEKHTKESPVKKGKKSVSKNKKINSLQLNKATGTISIAGNRTVQELESAFEKEFGMYVQVFRKSGNVWLETTTTDDWTLDEQNKEGLNRQEPIHTEKENYNDHDVW